jgi:hypothetical protein
MAWLGGKVQFCLGPACARKDASRGRAGPEGACPPRFGLDTKTSLTNGKNPLILELSPCCNQPHRRPHRLEWRSMPASGSTLTQYDVDVAGQFLFVASSDSAPGMGSAGNTYHVTAFRIEAASGALSAHGDPIPLLTRPIHMTTDILSEHQQPERDQGLSYQS